MNNKTIDDALLAEAAEHANKVLRVRADDGDLENARCAIGGLWPESAWYNLVRAFVAGRMSAPATADASCSDAKPFGIPDPPPPPPPGVTSSNARACVECGAREGDGREGCIETYPPVHKWSGS